jgi:hypothetical protein
MNATSAGPVLRALTVCVLLARASAYAAGTTASVGESAPANDTVEQSERALATGTARRDESGPHGPIRSGDTAIHGSKSWNSVARNGSQPATLHADGLVPTRSVATLPGARTRLLKPAVAATHAYSLRRLGAEPRPRPTGATNLSAPAGRQPSSVVSAASRSTAILRPMAITGVIGGPRAAGPGSVGGPANSRTMINASINGSALRRRS